MKLQILNDLHIEFAPFKYTAADADVVILAGDIHLGEKGFNWASANIRDKEVIYILGNHEFYKAATPRLFHKLKEKSKGSNIHVLENESISLDGVRFLGCTLWTDFDLLGCLDVSMATAKLWMNDYIKIRLSPQYRKIQPSFTIVWHRQSKKWLKKEFENCKEEKMVVVTHHAPSIHSIPPGIRDDPLSASYASDMIDFVSSSKTKLWIHGHIHTARDYQIGETRVVCNPRGYPDEPVRGFDPALTIEI